MAFDFKKEYRDLYMPKSEPAVITAPPMKFILVRGHGDPNEEGGEYKKALETLYALAYTIKMSKKGERHIEGYFDFVVPPLEGFWSQKGGGVIDYARKEDFFWISALRVPDFVENEDFLWAVGEVKRKKKADAGKAEFMTYEEGLCVQCMHTGPYDDEPGTVSRMNDFILREGYVTDISNERLHHEIYLSDPRRTPPEKLKTVIRHPIRRA